MMKLHPRMRWPLADGSIRTRIKQFIEINVTDQQVHLRIAATVETSCQDHTVSLSNTSIQQPDQKLPQYTDCSALVFFFFQLSIFVQPKNTFRKWEIQRVKEEADISERPQLIKGNVDRLLGSILSQTIFILPKFYN